MEFYQTSDLCFVQKYRIFLTVLPSHRPIFTENLLIVVFFLPTLFFQLRHYMYFVTVDLIQ